MMEHFGNFWGLYTVLMLALFIGIWVWAWSGKRKKAFDEAANLPFADEAAVEKPDLTDPEEKQP